MPFASGPITPFTMTATLSRMLWIESEVQQRIVMLARDQDYIPAAAAITSARASARDKLLPPEGETAVAPVSCFYGNTNFINEHFDDLTEKGYRQWNGRR
jgi:hypothetical protein